MTATTAGYHHHDDVNRIGTHTRNNKKIGKVDMEIIDSKTMAFC